MRWTAIGAAIFAIHAVACDTPVCRSELLNWEARRCLATIFCPEKLRGIDLLLTADWPALIAEVGGNPLPPSPGAPSTSEKRQESPKQEATPPPAPGLGAAEPPRGAASFWPTVLLTLSVVAGLALLMRSRTHRSDGGLGRPFTAAVAGSLLLAGGLILALYFEHRTPSPGAGEPLTVYCAAALRGPVEAIAAEYERESGRKIQLQYGSSESLLTTVKLSGKGDIFLPADSSYIEAAGRANLTREVLPVTVMTPVIAVRRGNPLNIRTLDDLLQANCRVVMATRAAAIGKLVREALETSGQWLRFQNKMQTGGLNETGTVTEVATSVKIGSADAGIIWDSMAQQFPDVEIVSDPFLSGISAKVELAVLSSCAQPAAALHFARYLTADGKGAQTFRRMGYRVAGAAAWPERPALPAERLKAALNLSESRHRFTNSGFIWSGAKQ